MARNPSYSLVAILVTIALISPSCGSQTGSGFNSGPSNGAGGASGSGGGGGAGGVGGSSGGASGGAGASSGGSVFGGDGSVGPPITPDSGPPVLTCPMPTQQNDFTAPIVDMGAPANAAALFAAADVGSDGPCMYEPESGALFPNNWIRLRFRFTTTHNENLFEIKLVVPHETSPLVLYTTQNPYVIPTPVWQTITSVGVNAPISIAVRSAQVQNGALTGGPWAGSSGTIQIAPVPASGTVVYWTTGANPSMPSPALKGFQMGFPLGEATPQPVLTPALVGGGSQCVACHTSSPDGLFAGLTTSTAPQDGGDPASMDIRTVDGKATRPPFLTPSAIALLGRANQQASSFSRAHWTSGDRVMLSMLGMNGTQIVWTDLEATGQVQGTDWGVIARNNDPNDAAVAQFSHDGQTIVYTSAPGGVGSGAIGPQGGHVYSVPYNNRMGGNATPVPGASDPAYSQCYASFSADDKYIVFNRDPSGSTTYDNSSSEVFITPFAGNMPTRLAANDPPACLGITSPGIKNSWGKWSPQALSNCGNTYYFLVFSSTRDPQANGGPQLYVAPIVVDGAGNVTTYSALYLWNQPEQEHNHTPAWDVFQIPVQCVGNGGGCTTSADCCNAPKVTCQQGVCAPPVQ